MKDYMGVWGRFSSRDSDRGKKEPGTGQRGWKIKMGFDKELVEIKNVAELDLASIGD